MYILDSFRNFSFSFSMTKSCVTLDIFSISSYRNATVTAHNDVALIATSIFRYF